jgi:hypothetical protein
MRTLAAMLCWLVLAPSALAQGRIDVGVDPALGQGPWSGRLVVFMVKADAAIGPGKTPADGPFWDDPQPIFAADASSLAPGGTLTLDKSALGFPGTLDDLPAGEYLTQARLETRRERSSWRDHDGNLISGVERVTVGQGAWNVRLTLSRATKARPLPEAPGVKLFTLRSELLSAFHGREVMLRAGVVLPTGFEGGSQRTYPAVYEVPGFGGDHRGAWSRARRAGGGRGGDEATLAREAFWIVLDPESPNGHTLFADSDNNGPVGRALVEELIPALEKAFPLRAQPEARLLRGHSSGGWSVCWLACTYPQTFGAAWPSAPDPVDFRRFQLVDLYTFDNMYRAPLDASPRRPGCGIGPDLASYRAGGKAKMTIRQEATTEHVLGPDNTSAQQWTSWQAVFGPRNERGRPAALYDPISGAIDKAVVERFKRYDLGLLLREQPARFGPIWRERIRLIVGDEDNFFLNEAVALLKADLDRLAPEAGPEGGKAGAGRITMVPGTDHGSVLASPAARAIPGQMLTHLRAHQLIPAP